MSSTSALKVCQRSWASALGAARTSARSMSTVAAAKDQLLACREELKKLVDEKNCAPILVRLGWHDSGTYDHSAEGEWPAKGGANGSIRFDAELGHGANAGLKSAVDLVEPLKAKFPAISYADLFQLASATAIEATGGPKIPMRYGRVDVSAPEQCPKEGNLPGAAAPFPDGAETPAQHIRNVFYRMGLTDKDIVALSGAHTLGRAHKNRSGMGKETTKFTEDSHIARADGKPGIGSTKGGSAWTPVWLKFDNSYFTVLRDESADPELLKMPTDKALFEDESFRAYATKYADDQDAFFADYAESHAKLSEQGSKFEPAEGIRLD